MRKKYQIIIVMIAVAALLSMIFKKQLYSSLVHHEVILTSGCVDGFCIGDPNEKFLDNLKNEANLDIAYNDGVSTKVIKHHKFLELEGQEFERLSLFKKGSFFTKNAFHLNFDNGKISSIQKEYYGPLYFDL